MKRSLLTEASGIPLAIEVDGANRHDVKLARRTLENTIVKNKGENLCVDLGYRGDEVDELAKEFGFTLHRSSHTKNVKKDARKKARRWVVERTHSWLNKFRGILIRWCKKSENYIAMLHLACGLITWRATGLLG